MTVIRDIRIPFTRRTLVTLWHVDPEADGTDDSCGWCRPKLTKKQRSMIECLAGDETRHPWFQRTHAKEPRSAADAEVLLRGAILVVAKTLRVRVTTEQATRWAIELIHNPIDNVRSSLALLPGWHTNSVEDTEYWRKEHATGLFVILARFVLREKRRWWQHPRWHFWHWKVQVHWPRWHRSDSRQAAQLVSRGE